MKGAQTFANYVRQDISEYAGNPLIEALPPILSEAAAVELISNFPQPVDPKELTLEGATRIHCIDRLRTVVQPFFATSGTGGPVLTAHSSRVCWA